MLKIDDFKLYDFQLRAYKKKLQFQIKQEPGFHMANVPKSSWLSQISKVALLRR